ncbi:peptide ABC transporter permease [Thermosipho melanesiensis]|uniref:Binding-protein-dependent transport systems inner membrane component n=2 Tax=Thermosipho melanesiensis TaxID=46541 RepID=A6LM92_THEM4|nr:ABC transporter permease [Thermosipho melanesiensis]ABR31043.1 binding-protein-dependent transport systems inner membrane component [Thermosipho melanesiensis BI429]APT74137.1 peptide ABC transporter permease [Thermosipho melanesiensis]OOC36085.1 peptide ABC transporter permease [Thermosipho melanesiensis]OOC36902.1 peptide ABC transporter permease [Thermosipho melanesiensis]OOC37653.1 peptide ABC transporter permease [Thermosipho melanesiensis]
MSLKSYIITRVILAVPMIFILLVMIFFILRIIPGDPVLAILGGKAPLEVIEAKRHELGLDKPVIVQFFDYIGAVFKGDLGVSTLTNRPVWNEIKDRFPATLELTIFSFLIALIIGVFYGAEAAWRKDKALDISARVYSILLYAIPVFWLGLMFQLLFGVYLRWFPVGGRLSPRVSLDIKTGLLLLDSIITWNWEAFLDVLEHLFLPGLTLGLVISSIFLRMVRNNTVLMLSKDFVKAAKARGLKPKVVLYGHAVKNAFVPIFTIMGMQFALLLAGAVLTETTFSWPGIGSYLVLKIKYRDFPAIQGTIVFFAMFVVIISILIDIVNALVDPRVRY